MKKLLLFLILSVPFSRAFAADPVAIGSDRTMLMELLNERKEKFSSYTSSLDEASGFFGNQTKKDVKKSNEILKDIVRLDNKMISILNRQVDYKNFEKTSLNYEQIDCENKLAESRAAMEALMKAKSELTKQNSEVQKSVLFYKVLSGALLLFTIVLLFRRKFSPGG